MEERKQEHEIKHQEKEGDRQKSSEHTEMNCKSLPGQVRTFSAGDSENSLYNATSSVRNESNFYCSQTDQPAPESQEGDSKQNRQKRKNNSQPQL